MGVRIYLSPIIGTGVTNGTITDPFRAKVLGSAIIPTHPQGHPDYGKPRFTWTLVFVKDVPGRYEFGSVDADPENERLFGIDLPDDVDTIQELKAYLRSRTVGEIPAARRSVLQSRLTARGVDVSGIDLQSTWFDVLRLIVQHLDNRLEP